MKRFFRVLNIAALLFLCLPSLCLLAVAQLETRSTFSYLAVSGSESFAVGDFNNDGNLDLAVAGGELQIFLGNGDGTFHKPISYRVGKSPASVTVADFNGDGRLDLAVANYLSSTVSILFGNGDGTFQSAATLNVPSSPSLIAAGDFNGDKKPDFLVFDGQYISVFLNSGEGKFGGPVSTTVQNGSSGLGMGDFDGNGTLDLAVAENTLTTSSILILLGNGDGTFTAGASYPILTGPMSVAVEDFRGDGRLDLAVASFLGGAVDVLLGNGDGTFEPSVNYTSDFANWVTTGDFNGDGKPDIIVSNQDDDGYSGGSVGVLLGNGDGTFQPPMVFPASTLSNFVAVGDFNGDQKLDIIDMDRWTGALITMLNTGEAVFSPTSPVTFPTTLIGTTSGPLSATLTNSGTNAMEISSLTCSGSPFKVTKTTCSGMLAPGAHCTVTTNFTAKAKNSVSGTLTIKDSASSKPQVVELLGTGTIVELSPPNLTFGPQKVGTKSAPQTIELTNTGRAALNFTNFIFVNGNNSGDFTESDTCGVQIGPGGNCSITITFAPRKTGPRNAFVQIEDDGGGSPQEPALSGTGD